MNEYSMIQRLARFFPRSTYQRNGLFESDAELLEIGSEVWAITVDDFSPSEDTFPEGDPYLLGRNLAVATIADLLACGAKPAFFLQALCIPATGSPGFFEEMAKGVASVLSEAGCHLCGGDLGVSDAWRFTGIAMGRISEDRPISRRFNATGPMDLWISGPLGDGNLAAAGAYPALSLDLRMDMAQWIARFAAACIDTSGGLWDSIWMLARQNPSYRLELDLGSVPVVEQAKILSQTAAFPLPAVLIGGAGEYELLFAVDSRRSQEARGDLESLGATCIGRALPSSYPGFFVHRNQRGMAAAPDCPDPRSASSRDAYVKELVEVARRVEAQGQ